MVKRSDSDELQVDLPREVMRYGMILFLGRIVIERRTFREPV